MSFLLLLLLGGAASQAQDLPEFPYGLWPLVTPLLGVGEECRSASLEYVAGLQNNSMWALQMLDSSGNLPFLQEGFLSDTMEVPVPLCSMLEDILAGAPCPDALEDFSLKIPYGYGAGLGSQAGCASVEGFPTHFCHNGIQIAQEAKAKMLPSIPVKSVRDFIQASDTEHMQELQQRQLKSLLQLYVPVIPSNLDTLPPPDDLPDSSLLIDLLRKQNPSLSIMIEAASNKISDTLGASCPECKATTPIIGQMLMFYGLAWLSVNGGNGGGMMGSPGVWPWPAYRACYPAACSKADMGTNSYLLGLRYGIPLNGTKTFLTTVQGFPKEVLEFLEIGVDPLVGCTSDERYNGNWKPESIVSVIFFSILAVCLVAGTTYDTHLRFAQSKNKVIIKNEKEKQPNRFLMSFSLIQNFEFVISSQQAGSDRLDCIEGIRALSMTWVVLGHSFLFSTSFLFINNKMFTDIDVYLESGMAFRAIAAGPYSVDTFFLIGATLVSYLLLKDLDKTNGWTNPKGFLHMVFLYVNRILRITIPYAIFILFFIGILPLLINKPMSAANYAMSAAWECKEKWYRNLLYIQTFNEDSSGCIGQTWFLATDMWFFIFSPLIIYPLWLSKFGRPQKVAAYLWWFLFVCLSVGWSARCIINLDERCWTDIISNPDFTTWGRRNQCYIIGLMLGHILHVTKGKEIKIPFLANMVIWQVVLAVFFNLVYAPYYSDVEDGIDTPSQKAWYTLSLFAWGLCLAWLIFACCRGLGGVINSLLTWSGWSPIAKISFMTYLVHMDFNFLYFLMQVKQLMTSNAW